MKTGAVPDEEVQLPGQYDIRDYMDQNENQQYADTTAVNTAAPFRRQCRWLAEAVQVQYRSRYRVKPRIDLRIRCRVRRTGSGSPGNGAGSSSNIQREQPVEQIYKMLNQEMAVAVVISAGFYKGKTLGQLALEKPQSLNWYVNDYKGRIICFVQRQNTFWMQAPERSINLTVNSEAAWATQAASEKRRQYSWERIYHLIWRMLQAWSGCR